MKTKITSRICGLYTVETDAKWRSTVVSIPPNRPAVRLEFKNFYIVVES